MVDEKTRVTLANELHHMADRAMYAELHPYTVAAMAEGARLVFAHIGENELYQEASEVIEECELFLQVRGQ